MAIWTFVDFNVPEARRLADLTGVEYDLRQSAEFCRELIKRREVSPYGDMEILQALCVAAITIYGRTLGTGVRTGISRDQIERLTPELQEEHQYFKDLRDKWIAHSVNAYEHNNVVARPVPEERGERKIYDVSVQHTRVAIISDHDIRNLLKLIGELLKLVNADLALEKASVLAFAQSLPVEPFYSGASSAAPVASRIEAGKPRKKMGES